MIIDDLTIARVVHVVAIAGWIGGVWFVTWVILPTVARDEPPSQRLAAFHRIEGRFAPQARIWVLLAGVSGFWMTERASLWPRFAEPSAWWMHAMLALWLLFAVMLFIAEPLVLHRRLARSPTPEQDFNRLVRAHRILSLVALATVAGAVGGAHGLF